MANKHVVPSPKGGWDVKTPGKATPDSHHRRQDTAVDAARQGVKQGGGGELITHGKDGQIREKDTIAPANDPFPPRG
jgi:hypothetical protein